MRNAVALVLGGGRGTRLFPLTSIRSKPAVPLGGMYRLIDIPISNCINSGIDRIFVLTQFMSVSLHKHIRRTYIFDQFSGGFVELLAAQETPGASSDWYQGTADAVRKNLRYFDQKNVDYVIILSGDQLYRMDYRSLVKTHEESGADVTISCMPVTRESARGFGVMRMDDTGRVNGFVEKPQTDEEINEVRTDPSWIDERGVDSQGRDCLGSMGIYVFNREVLKEVLDNEHKDFGKEVFPETISTRHVQMHLFDGYWEDIGTIRSFYEANLSLTLSKPPFKLFTPEAPVYARSRFLPPSQIGEATIKDSLICNGCRIGEGAVIENSIIGLRTVIEPNVVIRDSIVMGADYYESGEAIQSHLDQGTMQLSIGEGTIIEGSIVDKNCRIGKNVKIVNESKRVDTDVHNPLCVIRDGIPVIVKSSHLPDNWELENGVS